MLALDPHRYGFIPDDNSCLRCTEEIVPISHVSFYLRSKDEIKLSQKPYLEKVLRKFNMYDCIPTKIPLNKVDFTKLNVNDENCKNLPCHQAIGSLMYAMLATRPDLTVSVNILSRFQSYKNYYLWQCIKEVLRYIKGTLNLKLTYKKTESNILTGFSDSDWGSNNFDRKSTSGFIIKLFNCTILWATKRQNCVALSSAEAEYISLTDSIKEAKFLIFVLTNLNVLKDKNLPITIYEDNQSAIAIANNPVNHKRTKHFDIRYHYIRNEIRNKIIKLEYIPSNENLAGIFTKLTGKIIFERLRIQLGLH